MAKLPKEKNLKTNRIICPVAAVLLFALGFGFGILGKLILWALALVYLVLGAVASSALKKGEYLEAQQADEEAKQQEQQSAPAEPEPLVKDYKGVADYHYTHVEIFVPDELKEAAEGLEIGRKLFFYQEPKNKFDKKAVRVEAEGDLPVGYLYRNKLQDMVNDYLRRGDAVMGQVTENENGKIRMVLDFFRSDEEGYTEEDE